MSVDWARVQSRPRVAGIERLAGAADFGSCAAAPTVKTVAKATVRIVVVGVRDFMALI